MEGDGKDDKDINNLDANGSGCKLVWNLIFYPENVMHPGLSGPILLWVLGK